MTQTQRRILNVLGPAIFIFAVLTSPFLPFRGWIEDCRYPSSPGFDGSSIQQITTSSPRLLLESGRVIGRLEIRAKTDLDRIQLYLDEQEPITFSVQDGEALALHVRCDSVYVGGLALDDTAMVFAYFMEGE